MLEGERITLRAIEKNDLPLLREWYNDFQFRGVWSGGFNPISLEQFETRWADRNEEVLAFAIVLKETGELIGTVNCRPEEFNTGRLGFVLGPEKFRRKGYGSEANQLMMKICFLEKNFQKLFLWTAGWNIPAQKHAESLGFKEAVRLRNVIFRDGEWYEAICYDLLREEYLERVGHD